MHTIVDPQTLQPTEQDVVRIAGRNGGMLEVANRSDTRGPAVRSGKDKLYDPHDPTYARRCCEAIPRLVDLQLLRIGNAPKHFELTNFGWQLSRKLTTRN